MRRGQRIPRARKDYYSRHPFRVVEAFERAELDLYRYTLVKFLTDKIDSGRTGDVTYTLTGLVEALDWPLTVEALRQKLHQLKEQDWIDFDEVTRGQRSPWVFRLGRAAIDGESGVTSPRPPTDLQLGTPSDLEVSSNLRKSEQVENPQPERDPGQAQPPTNGSPRAEQSRAELSEEERTFSEEGYDHALGKGTGDELSGDGFLEVLQSLNGEPPVQLAADDEGELYWSSPPREGEAGVMADCQALVDAGLARWKSA
jgi:hypothetical protein